MDALWLVVDMEVDALWLVVDELRARYGTDTLVSSRPPPHFKRRQLIGCHELLERDEIKVLERERAMHLSQKAARGTPCSMYDMRQKVETRYKIYLYISPLRTPYTSKHVLLK